jgi:hypothetical protein
VKAAVRGEIHQVVPAGDGLDRDPYDHQDQQDTSDPAHEHKPVIELCISKVDDDLFATLACGDFNGGEMVPPKVRGMKVRRALTRIGGSLEGW